MVQWADGIKGRDTADFTLTHYFNQLYYGHTILALLFAYILACQLRWIAVKAKTQRVAGNWHVITS